MKMKLKDRIDMFPTKEFNLKETMKKYDDTLNFDVEQMFKDDKISYQELLRVVKSFDKQAQFSNYRELAYIISQMKECDQSSYEKCMRLVAGVFYKKFKIKKEKRDKEK